MVELDGKGLHATLSAGAARVIGLQDHLNSINVFPVPDGDTGSNLAATLYSMTQVETIPSSAGLTMVAMADAALIGARGNSGIIFAQFLNGFREKVANLTTIGIEHFIRAVEHAALSAASAISRPRDGTILSVIRDWSGALAREGRGASSYRELFHKSIPAAEESLRRTPEQLAELKLAGVVDAGAEGFVEFLKGAREFVETGEKTTFEHIRPFVFAEEHAMVGHRGELKFRFCTEALFRGGNLDPRVLRAAVAELGDSLIVAGGGSIVRIHIHTNDPAAVFDTLRPFGNPTEQKVDDMAAQLATLSAANRGIAIVTDSTCDLPRELLDRYRIHVVPMTLSIGEAEYLDRVTLMTDRFFELAESSPVFPRTSQPSIGAFQRTYSFLSSYYDSIIAIHLSSRLSGTCESSTREAAKFTGKRISVIDSRNLSGSLGLIVLRAARAVERGASHESIVAEVEAAVSKARIFVGVRTLKYMVRGGRVSPLKGFVARLLNLKPIVSLDSEGASELHGRSFSVRANRIKIAGMVKAMRAQGPLWGYAVVHGSAPEAAREFAALLERELGEPPLYIMPISPAIGLSAGRGSVAAVAMLR
ncbi:MAG TPA: DegV family protein [Spirochaetia bacterium]|nr:DegV family protein [Spirochaetia bacterium]